MQLGQISHWYAELGAPAPRPALDGGAEVDVAIVGAGYTGLWTAYALLGAAPSLRVALIERAFAGYGASGRNGGWLTGNFSWNGAGYRAGGLPELRAALRGAVDEVIAVAAAEGIDADIHRTEELTLATNRGQLRRMQAHLAAERAAGVGPEHLRQIEGADLAARVRVPGARAALVETGVARLQPAKLVQGLARAVERRGARIFERTEALELLPGRVVTARGTVRAKTVLRATEGYTAGLAQAHRDVLPLNSAQIVTQPLPAAVWDQIGWAGAELIGDLSRIYCYCQRTADDRIVLGSRGVPYRYGSRTDTDGAPDGASVRALARILGRYFPAAGPHGIAHAWCGVLGVPRDWCPSVGYDPRTGLGWAGGYVGVGVSSSNLAGRCLADLVLGRATALAGLPWVNHQGRRWEPEPLRWLGVRGGFLAMEALDRWERWGA